MIGLVRDSVAKGARVLTGGHANGVLMDATVLDHVTPAMRIYNEESFGPIVAIIRVRGVDEAVRVANDTALGAASSTAAGGPVVRSLERRMRLRPPAEGRTAARRTKEDRAAAVSTPQAGFPATARRAQDSPAQRNPAPDVQAAHLSPNSRTRGRSAQRLSSQRLSFRDLSFRDLRSRRLSFPDSSFPDSFQGRRDRARTDWTRKDQGGRGRGRKDQGRSMAARTAAVASPALVRFP